MMQLQRKVKAENFFGTTNRKENDPYSLKMDKENEQILNELEEA